MYVDDNGDLLDSPVSRIGSHLQVPPYFPSLDRPLPKPAQLHKWLDSSNPKHTWNTGPLGLPHFGRRHPPVKTPSVRWVSAPANDLSLDEAARVRNKAGELHRTGTVAAGNPGIGSDLTLVYE